ncbi:hypothetical protein mvi_26290 [Methylobacterium indicum]|uniref:Uncharacterized protein n=1 Tax=Methylobacterium indicum TaxID=1775910 RepID=A0A8H9C6S6_9HYPH|nr:hypothetical protein mvi_26290 [Methylobacterium indicum]
MAPRRPDRRDDPGIGTAQIGPSPGAGGPGSPRSLTAWPVDHARPCKGEWTRRVQWMLRSKRRASCGEAGNVPLARPLARFGGGDAWKASTLPRTGPTLYLWVRRVS